MPVLNNPHDDEELKKIRESQEDPLVQYYIVRKSLKMSDGKFGTQIAHAAMIFTLEFFKLKEKIERVIDLQRGGSDYIKYKQTQEWLNGSFRKITKKASDAKFEKIKEELECFLVKDAGLTEVEPGSETVLVLFPILRSKTPEIVHKLQNL